MHRLHRLPGRILLPLGKFLRGKEIETKRASSVRFEEGLRLVQLVILVKKSSYQRCGLPEGMSPRDCANRVRRSPACTQ